MNPNLKYFFSVWRVGGWRGARISIFFSKNPNLKKKILEGGDRAGGWGLEFLCFFFNEKEMFWWWKGGGRMGMGCGRGRLE